MLRPTFILAAALIPVSILPFTTPVAAQCGPKRYVALSPALEAGQGSLHWSVGPGAGIPRSVLHFDGVSSWEVRLTGHGALLRTRRGAWLLAGSAGQGGVTGGRLLDVDFQQSVESQRSVAEVTGRRTESRTAAVGWCRRLPSFPGRAALTLWAGWTRQRLDMRIQNGTELVPDSMPMLALDSRYAATWEGPWIAGEAAVQLARSTLGARLALHALDRYRAHGRWNLRYDLAQPVSYAQWANAWGWNLEIRYGYHLTRKLLLGIGVRRSTMLAKDGDDVVYASNGNVYGSQLIETRWQATTASFAIQTSF